jgi:soluble lytic murein transglycosylase
MRAVDRTSDDRGSDGARPAGRWAIVTAALLLGAGEPGKTADLPKALAALADNQPDAALAALDGGAGDLEDYRGWLRGRALAAVGRKDEAAAELARIRIPEPQCGAEPLLAFGARALEAELLAAPAPAKAAAILIALPPRGDILLRARDLFLAAKDPRAAEAEARLLLEVPDTVEARSVAASLGAAGVAKRLETTARRAARVERLLELHQNDASLAESRALLAEVGPDHAISCDLGYVEGKSLRKLRRYKDAIDALERARKLCVKGKRLLETTLLLAQVRAIRGEVQGTKKIAEWFLAEHREHTFTDDAMLLYANVLEQRGRGLEAKKTYQRMVDEIASGDETPAAAWQLAFMAIEAADHARAEELLRWILARDGRPIDHARARYWLARMLDARRAPEADAAYERVVLEPSFYAWLAVGHLARTNGDRAASLEKALVGVASADSAAVPITARISSSPELSRAKALYALGARDLAQAELARLACLDLAKEDLLALASAFDQIEAHPDAQLVLRSRPRLFFAKPLEAGDIPILKLAYSRPYADLVDAAAKAEKLDPLFLLALVREESTFDPEIVSWAGAIGLAQLMPATAIGAYADVFRKRLTDLDRLTDPELNLRLGARVLEEGMSRWRTEPLALSSYNGGHGLTERILPKEPMELDRWVETIPVKETRGYVKRVLETYGIYKLLYAKEVLDLPEKIGRPPT